MPKFQPAKSWEYLPNCFLKGHSLINLDMGIHVNLHCGKYSCPLHGWKKKLKLQKGIEKYLSKFKQVRFWTFTLSNKYFDCPADHYVVLSLAFRYFTTYMRRHKSITETEQEFQYVKVADLHKSGYAHFHAFFDRFISVYKVRELWQLALEKAGHDPRLRGSSWSNRLHTPKSASKYVSRYVVKTAGMVTFRLNYYSKSSRVSLFEKLKSIGKWYHKTPEMDYETMSFGYTPLLVPNKNVVTNSDQFALIFGIRSEIVKICPS